VEPGAQWLLGVGVTFPELAERSPSDNPHPRSVIVRSHHGASRGKSLWAQMPLARLAEAMPILAGLHHEYRFAEAA
jgi:hypothetical protein